MYLPSTSPSQWVKRPLVSGRLRITCDYPPVDVWQLRASPRLPAHLSTAALLGQLLCMVPEEQQGVASLWPPDAKDTGKLASAPHAALL